MFSEPTAQFLYTRRTLGRLENNAFSVPAVLFVFTEGTVWSDVYLWCGVFGGFGVVTGTKGTAAVTDLHGVSDTVGDF